jgi:hypothetical protein
MKSNEYLPHATDCECLVWKPIVAGALVILGFTFILNLFSVAIGLTAFTVSTDGAETLVMGGLLGIGIGTIASMFGAGWLTGYLGQRHCNKLHLGALYGFLAWCVALVIGFFVMTNAEQYVAIYTHLLSGTPYTPAGNAVAASTDAQTTKNLVISTYIIFSLVFLSAFASALGGHCGMRFVCKKTNP